MADDSDFNGIDWHNAQKLTAFLDTAPTLTPQEQGSVLDAAIRLLEDHYAHLPHKRVSQGVDPVARLRALHTGFMPVAGESVLDFHEALCGAFADLRDLHTVYLLPSGYARQIAFLPFQAGLLADPADPSAEPRVIVTHVMPGYVHAPFAAGAEIVSISGLPVARALKRLAARTGGANPPAARSRALAALTQRPLMRNPPPEEEWVEIGYRAPGTHAAAPPTSLRLAWRVCALAAEPPHQAPAASLHAALDIEGDALRRHRKQAYAPHVLAAEHARIAPPPGAAADGHPFETEIQTPYGDLRAWAGRLGDQVFGTLRIRGFKLPEDAFLAEIQRLLSLLPQQGLIIDIRDNPGGLVAAAERMLQYLSDTAIEPVRTQFLATPANLAMCRLQSPDNPDMQLDLSAWTPSLQAAIAAGEPWSDALPMTPVENCRDTGRLYPGRVVLITSARTYSAADIFSAGFRDNGVGQILGVDARTGAGGANMWTHRQLTMLCGEPQVGLPQGVELRVAVRRVLRSGAAADQVLEEAGITPDQRHVFTRRDLLENDVDLIAHAAAMLC